MLIQSHDVVSPVKKHSEVTVTIRGIKSGLFLCFNRNGKLVTRVSPAVVILVVTLQASSEIYTFHNKVFKCKEIPLLVRFIMIEAFGFEKKRGLKEVFETTFVFLRYN